MVHVPLEKDPENVNPPPGPVLLTTVKLPPAPKVALVVSVPLDKVCPVVKLTVPLHAGGGQSYPIPRLLIPASVDPDNVRSFPPLAVIVPSLFKNVTLVCANTDSVP